MVSTVSAHGGTSPISSIEGGYRVTVPAPRPEWERAFLGDPQAQAPHSPQWVDAVCAVGGFTNATRLYEAPDGRQLVLPLVRRPYLGGVLATQASLPPHWGVGGVISASGIQAEDLSAIYRDLGRQRGVLRTYIQPTSQTAALWSAADLPGAKTRPGLGHVLDLEGGFDVVWGTRFTKSARRAVQKAERSGVVVEQDSTGARLPEYWTLLEESLKRWAQQQHEPLLLSRWRARRRQTLEKMQAMAASVPDRFRLYLAIRDGRLVAGNVVYLANSARAVSAAMIKELAAPVNAMHLLERAAIEDACLAGSGSYDFGESGNSSGLALYKTRFGAKPQPYRMFVIERLPLTEADRLVRGAVKRVIRFEEPPPLPAAQPEGPAAPEAEPLPG